MSSGVGFGICCRFIEQLSYPNPPDIQLGPSTSKSLAASPWAGSTRLTLILACRSEAKATIARRLLLKVADEAVEKRKRTVGYGGHAEKFREGLEIDFIPLDLASIESVFRFGEQASLKYVVFYLKDVFEPAA
jgi:3-keto steroid reductase